jgi:mannan endo-1,4-beta-mannosidase
MKIYLCLVIAVLTGCAGFDFSLDCRLTENRLVCNGEFPDGGYRETDGGIEESIPNVDPNDSGQTFRDAGDSGAPDMRVDSGQNVDSSVPSVDASSPRDAGPVVVVPATGVFRVQGNKLFDPNGVEFRIRGNNRTHIDNTHIVANRFKSNTTRWLAYFISDPDRTIRDMTRADNGGSTLGSKSVAIPGDWAQTCADSDAVFEQIVQRWVAAASKYQAIADKSIVNIANEYSPSSDEKWRDKYIDAVKRIRAAGYRGNLEIDSRGCGQEASAVIRYGKDVLAADPDHNLHFSVHVYGAFYSVKYGQPKEWRSQDLVTTFDALAATGLHIVIGEIGPGPLLGGGNGGPSPTKIPATAIVAEAEARGFGWLLWSSDDNDMDGARCSDDSFCMTRDTNLDSLGSNLTPWGVQAVSLWETYGAKPASVF